jgi:hypothetical protein
MPHLWCPEDYAHVVESGWIIPPGYKMDHASRLEKHKMLAPKKV